MDRAPLKWPVRCSRCLWMGRLKDTYGQGCPVCGHQVDRDTRGWGVRTWEWFLLWVAGWF